MDELANKLEGEVGSYEEEDAKMVEKGGMSATKGRWDKHGSMPQLVLGEIGRDRGRKYLHFVCIHSKHSNRL